MVKFARLFLCFQCCSLFLFITSKADDHLPHIKYDLMKALIWRCPKVFESKLQSLEDSLALHIISRGNSSHVDFVSSLSDPPWLEWGTDADSIGNRPQHCVITGHSNVTSYNEMRTYHSPPTKMSHHTVVRRQTTVGQDWFTSYHNLSEIYEWFNDLAHVHSDKAKVITIGSTEGDREILAIKLSTNTANDESSGRRHPVVYLQCLLHAREWITGPVCMYIAQQLLTTSDRWLSLFDFIIVPVANPDGYELTWTDYPRYRLWRKNLRPYTATQQSTAGCLGVDLNRNFNVDWCKHGSSADDHCSETYCGPSPLSEKETKAISEVLHDNKPIVGAIDFHSYSQAILYPSGWTTLPVENSQKLETVARKVAEAAGNLAVNNNRPKYTSQQMGSIYLASGTFTDWINSEDFNKDNVDRSNGKRYRPVPLTVELYPHSTTNIGIGFMVTPDQILPTCKETFEGFQKYLSLILQD